MQANGWKSKHWANTNALVLSSRLDVIKGEFESRLDRRGWKIAHRSRDIAHSFGILRSGEVSAFIIVDTPELPAAIIMRNQLTDPIALLTPTLVISPYEEKDRGFLKGIGLPEILNTADNPAMFVDSLEYLLRSWSSTLFKKVYEARQLMIRGKHVQALQLMSILLKTRDLMPLITPPLSKAIRLQKDAKLVEKVLLGALKEFPRNLGIILASIDFYINMAMPHMARKIIDRALKNLGNPTVMIPEQIQTYIMMNDLDSCIPLLESLITENIMPQTCKSFLSRCLFAEGYVDGFINSIEHSRPVYEAFQTAWHKKPGESA